MLQPPESVGHTASGRRWMLPSTKQSDKGRGHAAASAAGPRCVRLERAHPFKDGAGWPHTHADAISTRGANNASKWADLFLNVKQRAGGRCGALYDSGCAFGELHATATPKNLECCEKLELPSYATAHTFVTLSRPCKVKTLITLGDQLQSVPSSLRQRRQIASYRRSKQHRGVSR
jgi:hypothetical protein